MVAQYPYAIGQMGVEACKAAGAGKTLPANVAAPVELVTKDNADQAIAATPKPFGQYTDPFTELAQVSRRPPRRPHRPVRDGTARAAAVLEPSSKDLSLLGRMGLTGRTRRCWSSSSRALNPTFLTRGNVEAMLVAAAILIVLTIGQTFVITTGGIDLSVAVDDDVRRGRRSA